MPQFEDRLTALGFVLPAPLRVPEGVIYPFPDVRIIGGRAFVSGHGPQEPDGAIAGPFGKVGAEVSVEDAVTLAEKTALSMLASLKRELGDLDRIKAWGRVLGMVNAASDFDDHPTVVNGFSNLILGVFGTEVGSHARTAVGVGGLPCNYAIEVEAEIIIG